MVDFYNNPTNRETDDCGEMTLYHRQHIINSLRDGLSRHEAAELCNFNYRTLYRAVKGDADFSAACDAAEEEYRDRYVGMLHARCQKNMLAKVDSEDENVSLKATMYALERKCGWIKPNAPQHIGGVPGSPIETRDVTLSANDAARRVALMLAKGLRETKED